MRFLFCNVGWMARYQGLSGQPDQIVGGGSYVNKNKSGHEVCNFVKCDDGYVYGHVETLKGTVDRLIQIGKIGAAPGDPVVDEITVVWTATDPIKGSRRVVGWYLNASVYRERQTFRKYPSRQHKKDGIGDYRVRAKSEDAYLLAPEERHLSMNSGTKGAMGHTPWWYADTQNPVTDRLLDAVSSMILGKMQPLDEVTNTELDPQTQLDVVTKARIGQDKFRKALINEWGGCSITGCKDLILLRAAHIKRWKDSSGVERLDSNNGLLLLPNLDIAFENGLIGFDDDGKIVISPHLSNETRAVLGINEQMRLRLPLTVPRREFLRHHRNVHELEATATVSRRAASAITTIRSR